MKRILLVVNMQKGFCEAPGVKNLVSSIDNILTKRYFDIVIGSVFTNTLNSMFDRMLCYKGMIKHDDTIFAINVFDTMDCYFDTYDYSCVNESFISKLCSLNSGKYPEQIYIAGASTEGSITKIALDLFERNIRPVIMAGYCASIYGSIYHEAALLSLSKSIGEDQIMRNHVLSSESLNI